MSRLFKVFVVMMLAAGCRRAAQPKPAAEKTPEQLKAEIAALQARMAEAKTLAEAQPVNVRLELTITDQRGDAPADLQDRDDDGRRSAQRPDSHPGGRPHATGVPSGHPERRRQASIIQGGAGRA